MKTTLLDTILSPGGLRTVFQPIWRIDCDPPEAIALEALTRGPQGSTLEAPDVLFEYARRRREEALVDRAAITTALISAHDLPRRLPLQLNVHASTLGRDSEFPDFLADACDATNTAVTDLTIEVIEESDVVDETLFLESIRRLREAGARIAIDDIGRGRSDLRMLVLVRPDEIKIDRYLVDGCSADPVRAEVLSALVTLANRWGSQLIGEGIETKADLETLRRLGVGFGQGYLLARPAPAAQLAAILSLDVDAAPPRT